METTMKKMTDQNVRSLHNLIVGINDKVNNINWGGCGIMAAILYDQLTKNGFECSIICLDAKGQTVEQHEQNLANISKGDVDNITNYSHFCIEIDGHFMDCVHIQPGSTTEPFNGVFNYLGTISRDALAFLISLKDQWNEWFDRKQVPEMEAYLDKLINEDWLGKNRSTNRAANGCLSHFITSKKRR